MSQINVLHEQLRSLLDDVRLEGMEVTPAQYIQAHRLFDRLQEEDRLPHIETEWRHLLAPILCHTKEQQSRFYTFFERWYDTYVGKSKGSAKEAPTTEKEHEPPETDDPQPPRLIAFTVTVMLLFFILGLGIVYKTAAIEIWHSICRDYTLSTPLCPQSQTVSPSAAATLPPQTETQAVELQTPKTQTHQVNVEYIQSKPLDPLIKLLIIFPFVLWVGWHWLKRQYWLQRQNTYGDPDLTELK